MPLALILLGTNQLSTGGATIDKPEEKKAFEFLNRIRKNPNSYSAAFGVDLSNVKARPALKWNDILAKVAEAKALDMANRHYFAHVDPDGYGINYYINRAGYKLDPYWLTNKDDNFFESIQAGSDSGVDAIKDLIIDEGTPNYGHRSHLLGMDDFNSSLIDIGIGFARTNENDNGNYTTYMSVVIAKHKD